MKARDAATARLPAPVQVYRRVVFSIRQGNIRRLLIWGVPTARERIRLPDFRVKQAIAVLPEERDHHIVKLSARFRAEVFQVKRRLTTGKASIGKGLHLDTVDAENDAIPLRF